jgi:hypothetical protein
MTEDVRYIERTLRRLRASKRRFYVTFGAAVVLATLALGVLVFSSIDLHVSLRAWLRGIFWGLLVFGALVLLVGLVVIPILRRLGILTLTWDVERTFPKLDAALATTVEYTIEPFRRTHYTSEEMAAALAGLTRDRIAALRLGRSIRWSRLRWPGVALAVLLIGLVSYVAFVPSAATALHRVVAPWEEVTYTRVSVAPGSVEREELSDLTVKAELAGRIPEAATIHYEEAGGEWRAEPMALNEGASRRHAAARHSFTRLARTFSYFVEAGDATSPKYTVTVYPDPKIEKITAQLVFPAYTELPEQTIQTGDVLALRGTTVTLTAATNTVLGRAQLVHDDGTAVPLALSDDARSATGSFVVEKSGAYELRIEDTLGHRNKEPKRYSVVALKDTVPEVRIIHPGKDLKVTKTSEVPVEFEVADDFGIDEVGLVLNVKMEGERREVAQRFSTRTLTTHGETVIALEQFPLEPHELVSYYVYAIDNDSVTGPKQGISNVYFIEIVPYEEKYRLMEIEGEGMELPGLDVLEELIRVQKEIIQKTFGLLNEATDPIEEAVWERVLGVASQQHENADLTADFSVTFQQELLARGLEQEIYKVQSIEQAAVYMRNAADLLESGTVKAATTPEQQALAALYKALTDLEHLIMQSDSSSAAQQRQEEIRQALELAQQKTRERAQQQQEERERQLGEEKAKLEELKARQHELNEQMAEQARQQQSSRDSTPSESSAQAMAQTSGQQKQLGGETKATAQRLDQMARQDPNLSSRAPTSTEKAAEKMDEAAAQLDQSEAERALEEGREAEAKLDEALQEIKQAEQRNAKDNLERLARNLDEAARAQSELGDRTGEAPAGSDELKKAAEEQRGLEKAVDDLAKDAEALAPRVAEESARAGEKLGEVSKELSSGEIQEAMRNAVEKMATEAGAAAQPSQEQAKQGLREAAELARDAVAAMSKTDKERLLEAIAKAREALAQQRGINRAVEEAAADATSSAEQKRAKAKQLASDQARAKGTADELLGQLAELAQGDTYRPEMNDFRDARREMDTAARALEEGNATDAAAAGPLAAERLSTGLDKLKALYGQVLLDDLAQAIRDADRLTRDQERVKAETAEMQGDTPTDAERAKTALRQKWVGDDAKTLAGNVEGLVEQAATSESDARERLDKAKATLNAEQLKSDLSESRTAVEEGRLDEATEKQGRAAEAFSNAKADLERAYTILTTSELERLWKVADQLGKIAQEIAKMREASAPTDEQKAQVAKALDEQAENVRDAEGTAEVSDSLKAAAEAMAGKQPSSTQPFEQESDRLRYVHEQVQQAMGVLVAHIDVLAKARKILLPKDETCPAEYEALVEYYYKVLSEF